MSAGGTERQSLMAIRRGSQYIQDIKSSRREVWLRGSKIEDVTVHPAFASGLQAVAHLYDLQHEPELAETLTFKSSDAGEPFGITFRIPATHDQLTARSRAIRTWAATTFGMFGRSPDFFNSAIAAFAAASEYFTRIDPRFGENIRNFYEYARSRDLFLTRATIPPQVDRSRSSAEQEDSYSNLRVVRETDAGLIVRGAKMISTNAPIADELLVFPLPGMKPGDEPYALSFCIPISTSGLRFICREPFDEGQRSHFDHPLSSRFEEIDVTCVFNDVLVPWERLFFFGDVQKANVLYGETMARNHAGHQAMVRSLVKAELLVGLAIALAETSKTCAFLHVQQMLGELIGDLEIIRALIQRSETEARLSPWGSMCPAIEPIQAFRCCFPRMNARMVEVIQLLGGGSLLSTPCEQDFDSPISSDIDRYFRGARVAAPERIALLKLAWDVTGDAFGQRQLLYERYHAGDPVRLAASQYSSYDTSSLLAAVRRATGSLARSHVDQTLGAAVAAD
jgi:4-hydroxyphenylacetate 3-monooxygenase oxygenase component